MVSTFTPNIQIEEPARGDDVGTWDTPVNANTTVLDLILGGVTTISGAAGSVVLAAAQFQSKTIVLNSTLIANITLTFPTSFKKSYEIQHACTGSSQFFITLQTTAAGGQVIGVPPGQTIECFTDGTNVKFKNLPPVGSYWDYAASSTPNWNDGCTIQPWLQCAGGAVSSATHPALFSLIGGALPDQRGRTRYALDGGTNRVTLASGVSGNTILAGGGDQLLASHFHANSLTDPGHTHSIAMNNPVGAGGKVTGTNGGALGLNDVTAAAFTGIGINNASAGSGAAQNMPPVLIHGITMIRAG